MSFAAKKLGLNFAGKTKIQENAWAASFGLRVRDQIWASSEKEQLSDF